MHDTDSMQACISIMDSIPDTIKRGLNRAFRHQALIENFMIPTAQLHKDLVNCEWLREADDEPELNCYVHYKNSMRVRDALEAANISNEEDISYVTLIPGKMELQHCMDELILEFPSMEVLYEVAMNMGIHISGRS